jgi:hypothetical protein
VPYPLQNNLHQLPAPMAHDALVGLIEAQQRGVTASSAEPDFGTWMLAQFGAGIVHQFMRPYNEKVWACRDAALRTIQPYLLDRSILSRGRFGAWRYELGNMDHAVKMGVDAAGRLLHGTPEQAWTL